MSQKITLTKKSKYIYFSIITFYFLISHLILPSINRKGDSFIFSRWDLFSGTHRPAIDISWDNGETFLFRNYRNQKRSIRLFHAIYHKTQKTDHDWLKRNTKSVKQFCNCENLKLFILDGEAYEHIIYKKKLVTKRSISL